MVTRRTFLNGLAGSAIAIAPGTFQHAAANDRSETTNSIDKPAADEDVFRFIHRVAGGHSEELYAQILGAANEFKEGDETVGVAAADDESRQTARQLLSHTRLSDIDAHSLHQDNLFRFIAIDLDSADFDSIAAKTLGELKTFLLTSDEDVIKSIMGGLSSDVIGCVVKLMSNDELIQIGRKVFNPLPGSRIGSRG